jgi:hypothetical protein
MVFAVYKVCVYKLFIKGGFMKSKKKIDATLLATLFLGFNTPGLLAASDLDYRNEITDGDENKQENYFSASGKLKTVIESIQYICSEDAVTGQERCYNECKTETKTTHCANGSVGGGSVPGSVGGSTCVEKTTSERHDCSPSGGSSKSGGSGNSGGSSGSSKSGGSGNSGGASGSGSSTGGSAGSSSGSSGNSGSPKK